MRTLPTQRGFSLISVMLMLAGMAAVATYQFREQAFAFQLQKGTNAGLQARMVNDGIEGYLANHATRLRSMTDNDCSGRSGCTPTAWFCVPTGATGDQCELDFARLSAEGYLPPNWQNLNPWGSPYKTVVTRVLKPNAVTVGNEMDYDLRAITATQAPWVDGDGKALLGLVGQAVRAGGADLAMTSENPNVAEGLARRTYDASMAGGTIVNWTADNSMNPWINGVGILVMRAGFESMGNNAFPELMRRDGSGMMQNNLSLGGNRVNNAQDAYVKKISGGRNLAAVSPTWVFKYSWRVGSDGAQIQKPDCSAQSGGWTNRTALTNPWDPAFAPGSSPNRSYDRGEARILVVNDYLANMQSLGYYEGSAACQANLTTASAPTGTSCPANDPYAAYDPVFRTRAKAAYAFYATDGGAFWNVFMRYYQNNTHNTASDGTQSSGIASVYCYYDNSAASACNGEVGCAQSGQSRPAGSAAAPDPSATPIASTTNPLQSPLTSGTPSQLPAGTGAPGARDVQTTF
jgi:hypothetical protein